jgi:hypothetical protein
MPGDCSKSTYLALGVSYPVRRSTLLFCFSFFYPRNSIEILKPVSVIFSACWILDTKTGIAPPVHLASELDVSY